MNTKKRLMYAASICLYVFTALYLVAAGWTFALSDYTYWMFLIFGLVSLFDGFVITTVREKMTSVRLEKREWIKYLVCFIISIVCLPAFILNAVAFFRDRDDGYEISEKPIESLERKEKIKKPFYKTKCFITMCVAFGMIFVSGFSAKIFETSGFSVDVSDFTLTREMTMYYNDGVIDSVGKAFIMPNDTSYAVTMYKPDTATENKPAPTVFVLPGFTRTKATMAQYAIELSRRGAVVFTIDPSGQGGTTETSTTGANGIEYLVQYVYNNTDDYKFCDKTRFGAIGHSAGGGNVCTLAADMSGETFEDSVIKSVYISGYIKTSSANKYATLNCNAALAYAYYDEGAFRYQSDINSFEVVSLRFINEVRGHKNAYDVVAYDYGYGSMADGTYRVVHREKTNHCFEMYDAESIANSVDFFDESLGMDSGLGGYNQIWFGKEFFNGIALASAFTFIIALIGVLMLTPFFATLINGGKKFVGKRDKSENTENTENTETLAAEPCKEQSTDKTATVYADTQTDTEVLSRLMSDEPKVSVAATAAVTESPVIVGKPLTSPAHCKSLAHKIIFWSCIILTAIIACLDYIPLANLSIEIFPTGNSASVYTYTFPARMINAILLWATINGAIGLVIFFGTTAIENLYEYIKFKTTGAAPSYDWEKFKLIKIGGNGKLNVFLNVLKTLLIGFGAFGVFYLLDQISYWIFHQDFRFLLISAAPLNGRMFVTALEYIPLIFIFYISNSIRVNCSIAREGWSEWKVLLVSALANSVGLGFILLINYVCFFKTGTPYYAYWGDGNEVWLYVNMVFSLVVMMFILPIFNRLIYKKTGNVWTGAIVCCTIFIMMTISASVSYIPMY